MRFDLVQNLSFGKWVFASNITGLIACQLYPWFLAGFHGTKATGIFSACWSLVAVVNVLQLGIGNFLGPKTAHASFRGLNDLHRVVHTATAYLVGFAGVFFLMILIFGGQLIEVIYTSKYAGNAALVSVLALSVMASTVGSAAAWGIWAMGQPKTNFKVNLLSLGLAISLGAYLVESFGPMGAACSLLAGNAITSIIRYVCFIHKVRAG
jgi:O-antigen/teichoic acid export membrane protein